MVINTIHTYMHICKDRLLSESSDCGLNTSMKSKTQIYYSFSIVKSQHYNQTNMYYANVYAINSIIQLN